MRGSSPGSPGNVPDCSAAGTSRGWSQPDPVAVDVEELEASLVEAEAGASGVVAEALPVPLPVVLVVAAERAAADQQIGGAVSVHVGEPHLVLSERQGGGQVPQGPGWPPAGTAAVGPVARHAVVHLDDTRQTVPLQVEQVQVGAADAGRRRADKRRERPVPRSPRLHAGVAELQDGQLAAGAGLGVEARSRHPGQHRQPRERRLDVLEAPGAHGIGAQGEDAEGEPGAPERRADLEPRAERGERVGPGLVLQLDPVDGVLDRPQVEAVAVAEVGEAEGVAVGVAQPLQMPALGQRPAALGALDPMVGALAEDQTVAVPLDGLPVRRPAEEAGELLVYPEPVLAVADRDQFLADDLEGVALVIEGRHAPLGPAGDRRQVEIPADAPGAVAGARAVGDPEVGRQAVRALGELQGDVVDADSGAQVRLEVLAEAPDATATHRKRHRLRGCARLVGHDQSSMICRSSNWAPALLQAKNPTRPAPGSEASDPASTMSPSR